MAVKLKTLNIPTYNINIVERKEYFKVSELFSLLKHKPGAKIMNTNLKGSKIKLSWWNIYLNNYNKNNNVCKCSICGTKATHVVLLKLLGSLDYTLRFFTIKNKKEMMFNIDHITPISKGGKDEIDNLQVTCVDCNELKSNKTSKKNNVPCPKHITNNVAKPNYKNNIVFKQCYKINNVGLDVTWTSTMFANNV
jgi:hypothetical protein